MRGMILGDYGPPAKNWPAEKLGDRHANPLWEKIFPYTAEELYHLVVDIEKYPNFLPWCLGAHIHAKTSHFLRADLIDPFPQNICVCCDPDTPYTHWGYSNLWFIPVFEKSLGFFSPCEWGCQVDFFYRFWIAKHAIKNLVRCCHWERCTADDGGFSKTSGALVPFPWGRRP